jgi:hypothetical protein
MAARIWHLYAPRPLLVSIFAATNASGMQIVRKDDLCVVSLKSETTLAGWMASHNRIALCAKADNAAHSGDEHSIILCIKLQSCAPVLPVRMLLGCYHHAQLPRTQSCLCCLSIGTFGAALRSILHVDHSCGILTATTCCSCLRNLVAAVQRGLLPWKAL